jgi:hypothetical protein
MRRATLLLWGVSLFFQGNFPCRVLAADAAEKIVASADGAASADSSLIEKGRIQAKEAASGDLFKGLLFGAAALGGLGLLAAGGTYVWWLNARRQRRRTSHVMRLLMLPTAYPTPPEPPVPDALPQTDAGTSERLRNAA